MRATSTLAVAGRRAAWLVPVLLVVVTITFVLMHLAPGGPWDQTHAVVGGAVQRLSPAETHALKAQYGLDKPLATQFVVYLGNLASLNLGQSYRYQGQSVRSLVSRSWRDSAILGGLAFAAAMVAGVTLGLLAALRRRTAVDHLVTGFATVASSVPSFVTATAAIIVLSVGLHQLTGGRLFLPEGGFGLDAHLVLPVLTIALLPAAYLARLTRASVIDTLVADHVNGARARGVHPRTVIVHHVARNSLVPVVTALGPMLAHLVTGAIVVEEVFHIPGLGSLFVEAVSNRDYPTIMATTVVFAVVVALANLAVDLLYLALDPRMADA